MPASFVEPAQLSSPDMDEQGDNADSITALLAALAHPSRRAARRRFLAGGLAALRGRGLGEDWTQVGVSPVDGDPRPLYGPVADLFASLRDDGLAANAFFMHKPPGLRLRLQAPPDADEAGARQALDAAVSRQVAAWAARSMVTDVEFGVYEPEDYLFGGPAAMPFAHQLFTADSLGWLAYHQAPAEVKAALPGWAFSLAMLRAAADGLGIVGWEHRGVWQAVARAGRRLAAAPEHADYGRAAQGVRAYWRQAGALLAQRPAAVRALVEPHLTATRQAADAWRAGYFQHQGAEAGARSAAAYHVIFHWNRGALLASRQMLLTAALVADDDAHAADDE